MSRDYYSDYAVETTAPETYRTLQNNLEKALFRQQEPSFRWARVK